MSLHRTEVVHLLVHFSSPDGAYAMFEALTERYLYNPGNREVEDTHPALCALGRHEDPSPPPPASSVRHTPPSPWRKPHQLHAAMRARDAKENRVLRLARLGPGRRTVEMEPVRR